MGCTNQVGKEPTSRRKWSRKALGFIAGASLVIVTLSLTVERRPGALPVVLALPLMAWLAANLWAFFVSRQVCRRCNFDVRDAVERCPQCAAVMA